MPKTQTAGRPWRLVRVLGSHFGVGVGVHVDVGVLKGHSEYYFRMTYFSILVVILTPSISKYIDIVPYFS